MAPSRLALSSFCCVRIFLVVAIIFCIRLSSSFDFRRLPTSYQSVLASNNDVVMQDSSSLLLLGQEQRHSNIQTKNEEHTFIDTRPYEQRAQGPRTARRMNHAFKYLYRHDVPSNVTNSSSFEYLNQFCSAEQVIQMNITFPPLLNMSVTRHLHPKRRFLQETMGLSNLTSLFVDTPYYFGTRLERTVAPRHAFLVYNNLPHGQELLIKDNRWKEFLISCRKTKRFCALCNTWLKEKQATQEKGIAKTTTTTIRQCPIRPQEIEAFDAIFGRGILAAARDDLCQWNNTWPFDYVNVTSSEIIKLLIQHGANPLERDNRGITLLHWAAGVGNLKGVETLIDSFPLGTWECADRDGATPLHFAAAGANSKEFGIGGHVHVCRFLLSTIATNSTAQRELVNSLTHDGNSPLMWAGWSGSLDTVKLLTRHRADTNVANRNGCTVAHWAASGGNLDVCQYLYNVIGVDFTEPNHGGNTPLTHAVAFGRANIVKWLHEDVLVKGTEDDTIAAKLAQDFCDWKDGEEKRKKILEMFQDWYGERNSPTVHHDEIEEDDDDDDVF